MGLPFEGERTEGRGAHVEFVIEVGGGVAADGVTPIALSNGVQYAAPPGVNCTIAGSPAPCDPIFTLVQPVRTE